MNPDSGITIIAHRGASGYLPEHTLEAKALAHGLGADFLEQDVVLTRDDIPIVLHDIHLDTVSDVARRFPARARPDGRFYAIDFALDEIRTLTASERFHHQSGEAVFPGRFPPHQGRFRIPTLAEELQFIQGLNQSTGREAGIYPEVKQPAFHHTHGKDISRIVLGVLAEFGYDSRDDRCYLQCFDAAENERIRRELGSQLTMVQLLENELWLSSETSDEELKRELERIATYAQGIGPPVAKVFGPETSEGFKALIDNLSGKSRASQQLHATHPPPGPLPKKGGGESGSVAQGIGPPASTVFGMLTADGARSRLVDAAQAAGLVVHPWTYRADALPPGFDTFQELHDATKRIGIDGIFTDFPDQSRRELRR